MSLTLLLALAGAAAGCEPASVTGARNQLRRGGERVARYNIHIADTTFNIVNFLDKTDTTTTSNGLVGIKFDPESVTVDVGNQLRFSGISFDPFSFSFDQMLQTTEQGPVAIVFPAPPPPGALGAPAVDDFPVTVPPPTRFSTPAGSSVVTATAGSGYIVRSMTNSNTGCNPTVTITLEDSLGNTIASFPDDPTTVNNNSTVVDSIPAAGITVAGYAQVNGSASFGACVPNLTGSVAASVTFRPMTLTQVGLRNVNEGFNQTYTPLQTDMQSIDSVFVSSGSFSLTLQNRLPIADTLTVRLNGVTVGGVVQTQTLAVAAAPGDGTYTSGTLTFNLAGARIVPSAVVAQVTGTAKSAPNTTVAITPTNANNAALVNGGGTLVIQSIYGPLDPAKTPKLTASVENSRELPSSSIDFKDLKDAIQSSTLNTATATLTVQNTAQTPVTLTNFRLGAVQIDPATGQPRRVGGNLDYEKDGAGTPILITIANPNQSTFTISRAGVSSVALAAAPLLDRVAHLLINNTRVALVTSGTAAVGDGSQSSITRTDSVKVRFQLVVGLDLTIPLAGVEFKRNQTTGGLDLSPADADQLASHVVTALTGARVTNNTPFGVVVNMAVVKDSVGPSVDIFALPVCTGAPTSGCRVSLDSVRLSAPTVSATGIVTTPTSDSVSVSISGANARALFGRNFTAGVRIRLLPGTGGNGRGAIRPSDGVAVRAGAAVDVRIGGGQ
ncbi:MAG: hypothetical protein HY560_04270 [Gemmatimonadetes bacterium]|nr:hypothetical protein [Gemmatimonadota bacterium]